MPLDPEMERLLTLAAAAPALDFDTLDPAAYRARQNAYYANYQPTEEVGSVEERTFPGPGGELRVRVYRPEGDGPFGGLVFFHGGGFVIYNLDSHDHEARRLANLGNVVVVSVDYRLAPEHRFPAAVEDAVAAVSWVTEHAAGLAIDPARLGVGGDSAGGNLAAVVAQHARDNGGPALAFQLLVYPMIDFSTEHPSRKENGEGYLLTAEQLQWLERQYVRTDEDRFDARATPLLATSLAGLPPAHVVSAEFDPLRDEVEAYAKRLEADGVPVTLTRWDGAIHGVFQMSAMTEIGKRVIEDAGTAVRRALGS